MSRPDAMRCDATRRPSSKNGGHSLIVKDGVALRMHAVKPTRFICYVCMDRTGIWTDCIISDISTSFDTGMEVWDYIGVGD